MQHISQDKKKDLLDGAHLCRHSEGAAAVSSDQFGEQMNIKQGKEVEVWRVPPPTQNKLLSGLSNLVSALTFPWF